MAGRAAAINMPPRGAIPTRTIQIIPAVAAGPRAAAGPPPLLPAAVAAPPRAPLLPAAGPPPRAPLLPAALAPPPAVAAAGPPPGLLPVGGIVDPAPLSIRETIERIDRAVKDPSPASRDQVPIIARPVIATRFTISNTISPHILYQTVMLKSNSFKRYLNINKERTFLVKDYDSLAEFFRENTNFTAAGTVDKVYSVNVRRAIDNPGMELTRIIEYDPTNPNYTRDIQDFTIGGRPSGAAVISTPIVLNKTIRPPEKSFHEFYEAENTGCGRQSLNNLLGAEIFDKGISDPTYVVDDDYIYNMVHRNDTKFELMALCQRMHAAIDPAHPLSRINLAEFCSSDENYHHHVLRLALIMLGFNSFEYTGNIPILVRLAGGEILNLQGLLLHCNGRWTILRKYTDGRQVKFRYIDPMASETPEELILPNGNIVSKDDPNILSLSRPKTSVAGPAVGPVAAAVAAAAVAGPPPKGDARQTERDRLKRVNRGLIRPPWREVDVNTLVNQADRNYPGRFEIGDYQTFIIGYMNTQANQQAVRAGLPYFNAFHI